MSWFRNIHGPKRCLPKIGRQFSFHIISSYGNPDATCRHLFRPFLRVPSLTCRMVHLSISLASSISLQVSPAALFVIVFTQQLSQTARLFPMSPPLSVTSFGVVRGQRYLNLQCLAVVNTTVNGAKYIHFYGKYDTHGEVKSVVDEKIGLKIY